jgi:hypothetical protein
MKKKFLFSVIALLSISLFMSCPTDGGGGDPEPEPTPELDLTLRTVLEVNAEVGSGSGTSTDPKLYTVSLPYGYGLDTAKKQALGATDIVPTDTGKVTVELYKDSFTGEPESGTIPLAKPGEGLEVYVKVSATADTTKAAYYKVTITIASAKATVGSVVINGTIGKVISLDPEAETPTPFLVEISIVGNSIGSSFSKGESVGWITNLPGGLSAAFSDNVAVGTTTVTLAVSGTPQRSENDPLAITIPKEVLTDKDSDLTVDKNENAKFAILSPPTNKPVTVNLNNDTLTIPFTGSFVTNDAGNPAFNVYVKNEGDAVLITAASAPAGYSAAPIYNPSGSTAPDTNKPAVVVGTDKSLKVLFPQGAAEETAAADAGTKLKVGKDAVTVTVEADAQDEQVTLGSLTALVSEARKFATDKIFAAATIRPTVITVTQSVELQDEKTSFTANAKVPSAVTLSVPNGKTLSIEGGTFTVDAGGTLAATGTVAGTEEGAITINGTLSVPGTLSVAKTLTLNGPAVVTGTITVATDGILTVGTKGKLDVTGSGKVETAADGSIVVNGSGSVAAGNLKLGAGTWKATTAKATITQDTLALDALDGTFGKEGGTLLNSNPEEGDANTNVFKASDGLVTLKYSSNALIIEGAAGAKLAIGASAGISAANGLTVTAGTTVNVAGRIDVQAVESVTTSIAGTVIIGTTGTVAVERLVTVAATGTIEQEVDGTITIGSAGGIAAGKFILAEGTWKAAGAKAVIKADTLTLGSNTGATFGSVVEEGASTVLTGGEGETNTFKAISAAVALKQDGNSLTISNGGEAAGKLEIGATAGINAAAGLTIASGEVLGTGKIIISGETTSVAGTIAASVPVDVAAGATLGITGTVNAGESFSVAGTVTLTSPGKLVVAANKTLSIIEEGKVTASLLNLGPGEWKAATAAATIETSKLTLGSKGTFGNEKVTLTGETASADANTNTFTPTVGVTLAQTDEGLSITGTSATLVGGASTGIKVAGTDDKLTISSVAVSGLKAVTANGTIEITGTAASLAVAASGSIVVGNSGSVVAGKFTLGAGTWKASEGATIEANTLTLDTTSGTSTFGKDSATILTGTTTATDTFTATTAVTLKQSSNDITVSGGTLTLGDTAGITVTKKLNIESAKVVAGLIILGEGVWSSLGSNATTIADGVITVGENSSFGKSTSATVLKAGAAVTNTFTATAAAVTLTQNDTGITMSAETGGVLTLGATAEIGVNKVLTISSGKLEGTATTSKISVATGGSVGGTAGNIFYPSGTTDIGKAVAGTIYTWAADAGGSGTAGWKAGA